MLDKIARHLKRYSAWWLSASLFLLNAFIVRDYFRVEYTYHMDSIEAAYIGLSRYWMEHPFEWGWFREWYMGIPFQNTYPPLLHAVVAMVASILNLSPGLAHHAVSAFLYCLAPVALFWLCLRFSGDRMAGFAAALAFSLLSPSALFSPSIAQWSNGFRDPARMHAMVAFGDTPHVSALALIPLALLALHAAMERTTVLRVFLAAFGLAAVVLTNWLGAFALALAVLCYLLAREDGLRAIPKAVGIGLLAYALAAPWVPPSTILDIQRNAQFVGGEFPITRAHALYWAVIVITLFTMRWIMLRLRANLALRFAVPYTLVLLAIFTSGEWWKTPLMPQPHRYHIEFEMALAAVFGFAVMWVARRRRELMWATAVLAVLATGVQTHRWFKWARVISGPIDIESTVEYRAAQWLQANLPQGRVFLSGDTMFWLNAFSDVAQTGGGFAQGVTNRTIPIVHYAIPFVPNEGEKLVQWLRIYGNDAVLVAGPKSRDLYRQVWNGPDKFDGILTEIWRDGDDVIYDVPRRSRSLAHVVRVSSIPDRLPYNALDMAVIDPLVADLENPEFPVASFRWEGRDRAVIEGNPGAGQRLYVQVSYHPGWRASAQGRAVPIRKDALDFMVLDPRCTGVCEVVLEYDGGTEAKLARAASLGALVGGAVWTIVGVVLRRRRKYSTR